MGTAESKKVAFITLGCKVNQYESEAMRAIFEHAGYDTEESGMPADVCVVNTCTITGEAEKKSRQAIRKARARNPAAIIAVTGCYPQISPDEALKLGSADIILGTRCRDRIMDYINRAASGEKLINGVDDISSNRKLENFHTDFHESHTRAFIKIQDGCDNFCSYCIIPFARGPGRSRGKDDILNEAARLASSGYKEIVLTGVNIESYGKGSASGCSLDELLRGMNSIDRIDRIRLGSIEPGTVTGKFINTVTQLDKFCPHFHISLQSGCDATLIRMNRKYTTSMYRSVISELRQNIADVSITTDIMVGFPGETDEEFSQTLEFLKEMKLSGMHVFRYSPRKGTAAANYANQVRPEVKERRSAKIQELAGVDAECFNKKFIGRVLPVLFEQEAGEGIMEGYSHNYIKVLCRTSPKIKGNIAGVFISEAYSDHAAGIIQDEIQGEIQGRSL